MGTTVSVRTSGIPKMRHKLQETRDAVVSETGWAMYDEFLDIMDQSRDMVPYDQGDLHDSAYVNEPQFFGEEINVDMGYGNAQIEYAIVQHENLDFNHPNGRQAKYLEIPMLNGIPNMPRRMRAKMLRELYVRLGRF